MRTRLLKMTWSNFQCLKVSKVQCLKVFCYHGNKSTILLFYSRTLIWNINTEKIPNVTSKFLSHVRTRLLKMTWSNFQCLKVSKVQCLKVFCYHGNKSTILLFYSIYRRSPEVSSKLYFVEICQVSEKLWLFNHRRADFWLPNFGSKRSLLSLLKVVGVDDLAKLHAELSTVPPTPHTGFFLCCGEKVCSRLTFGIII